VESGILRKRFVDTAVADVLRAVDGGAEMGANALALCLPDYLSYLRDPSPMHKKKKYKRIVQDYLAPLDAGYVPAEIYALRCSLVHVFGKAGAMTDAGLEGFAFCNQRPDLHLKRDATTVVINSDTFLADVIWGVRQFLIDHDGDANVEAAADKLLRVGVGMEQVRGFDLNAIYVQRAYASMHRALSEFDSATPRLDRFRTDLSRACFQSSRLTKCMLAAMRMMAA